METEVKIFVPGRVCLFGEHSDWAGGHRRINSEIEKGYTIITGTDQGIYADVAKGFAGGSSEGWILELHGWSRIPGVDPLSC
jgi:hypothetical protein